MQGIREGLIKRKVISKFYYRTPSDIKCCLQTIIYLSHFELRYKPPDYLYLKGNEGKGILVNIKKKDGRASLFWSVWRNGSDFLEKEKNMLAIEEIQVAESWKKVSQVLLLCLIDSEKEGQLQDETPVINLIPLSGIRRDLTGENILDKLLFQIKAGERPGEHVQYLCPYSQESSMDVFIRTNSGRYTDLLKLDELGSKPNIKRGNFAKIMEDVRSKGIPFQIHSAQNVPILDSQQRREIVEEELKLLKTEEKQFKARLEEAFVPKWKTGIAEHLEAKIAENIFVWVSRALSNCLDYNPDICPLVKLNLSGSTAEGCRLRTRVVHTDPTEVSREAKEFEVDLVLEANLNVR